MGRTRILWLSYDPRGTYSFSGQSQLLCRALSQKGYDLHFLALDKKDPPEQYCGYWLYPYPEELGRRKSTHKGSELLLREYLTLIKPDVIITLINIAYVEYLAELSKKEFPHIPWLHWGPVETTRIYKENIPLEKAPSCFITVTDFARRQKKKYLKNVVTIGHAVDSTIFHPLDYEAVQKKRDGFGLKKNDLVFGCLAVNNIRKQLPRLLQAFALATKAAKHLKLLLYTTRFDPLDPQSIDLEYYLDHVFHLRSSVRIVYSDALPQVPAPEYLNDHFYNCIDCFVLATAGEGFCIPLVEALFCQKPVLVTDCPNVDEIVINGRTGLLAGPATKVYDLVPGTYTEWVVVSIEDLAKKMKKLYQSPALRKKLAAAGYRDVQERFALDRISDRWDKLIARTVRKGADQGITAPKEQVQRWLALEYFKRGKFAEVLKISDGLVSAPIHNLRGHCFKRLGLSAEALAEFQKALKLDPSLVEAQQAIAQFK